MAPSFATFSRCCALSLVPTTRSFSVFLHTSQLLNPLNRQIPLSQQQVYTKSSKQPYHRHYRSPDNSRETRATSLCLDRSFLLCLVLRLLRTDLILLKLWNLAWISPCLVYFSLKDILPPICYTKIHQKAWNFHLRC